MRINLEFDTNSTEDIGQLANLATVLGGKPAIVAHAAPKPVKDGAGKELNVSKPDAGDDGGEALKNMTGGERVTIEQVRTAAGTKKAADCKAVFADMGFDGLSKIPADRLPEALERIKALKDK